MSDGSIALVAGAAITGLVVGSYCVTAGIRWGRGESSLAGRSHCDLCGVQLGFLATVPIVSYLGLGGACAACGGAIDPLHTAGEATGALMLGVAVAVATPLRAALMGLIGFGLIAASAADLKVQRLPNPLVASVGLFGLLLSALAGWPVVAVSVVSAVMSAAALLGLRRWMASRNRGESGLGLGDVKLIAALALWVGPAISFVVLIAAILGLAVAAVLGVRRGQRLAFGPMIALAGWVVGAWSEAGGRSWG